MKKADAAKHVIDTLQHLRSTENSLIVAAGKPAEPGRVPQVDRYLVAVDTHEQAIAEFKAAE